MAGPLAGIKVIEVGQALAGPLAGMILADMGAEVIKVEKPDGGDDARLWGPPFIDGDALFFHSTNRNKKSVTLAIKSAEDVGKLKRLVREADILIQNLRPGIVGEMGIGPDVMIAENPRLIYCSIWAFGHKGPLRNAPGFDPLLQAYGGVMTMTGRPEDPPTFCGPAINDISTGMWCVIGALGALQQRQGTGRGCVIDCSLFESAVSWVGGAVSGYLLNGNIPKRHGTGSNLLVPYQVFETADRPICIAAGNDRLWVKCAQALGKPEWATDERFSDGRKRAVNREALIPMIAEVVRAQTREHWIAALGKVGVPVAPVNNVAELAQSEQLAAMDMKRTLPGSNLAVIGLPLNFDGQRPHPHSDSPRLGQHNDEVFG
jgi:formyl-CoA transferase